MSWRGQPLDPSLRELLEAFFDDDLGSVRVHRGWGARLVAALLGASAVALGRRLYFSPAATRRLATTGASGVALVAHEVTHALQYRRHGLLGMLGRYLLDYLRGRRAGLGHHAAYRAIPFEREAWEIGDGVRELLADEPEALRGIAGGRLPAALRQRAAEAGARVRSAPSRGSAPRAG